MDGQRGVLPPWSRQLASSPNGLSGPPATPCLRPHAVRSPSRRLLPFTDPRLCAAIVDRLTFGANIIETGTHSYRLAHTLAHR